MFTEIGREISNGNAAVPFCEVLGHLGGGVGLLGVIYLDVASCSLQGHFRVIVKRQHCERERDLFVIL